MQYVSRGKPVPATITTPARTESRDMPLVLMAHGHGGTRDEAGAFVAVATELAKQGIASLRMDFPGCGENTAAFSENNLTHMLIDLDAGLEFGLQELAIDPRRVAILGYSMGARVAILSTRKRDYQAMVLWAPVGLDGAESIYPFLGGESSWKAMKRQATEHGHALLVTQWGDRQELGLQWFADMETSQPESVISGFEAAVQMIHGLDDSVVVPENSRRLRVAATAARSADLLLIPGADHGLGFYSDQPEISGQVIEATVSFLVRELLK